jgi:CRP-like cAMP-binding protein
MAENSITGSDRRPLDDFKDLGSATAYAEQIFALVGHSQFFAEFNRDDIRLLAGYMNVYQAQPGKTIIREGDIGDYMLLIIAGEVDIYKKNRIKSSNT